jgi:hypothetical protein
MEPNKTSIVEQRVEMLHEAIRDEQATIFSIDEKARTLLMVNSITVPLTLGVISFTTFNKEAFHNLNLQNPIALTLFAVLLLLFLTVASVLYLTLRIIGPRIRLSEKITYPEELAHIRKLDVYFPVFKEDKVDFGEYKKKLQEIEDQETIELILLSELLFVSLIRDDKTKTMNSALVAMAINAVLILIGIFLFLLLLL